MLDKDKAELDRCRSRLIRIDRPLCKENRTIELYFRPSLLLYFCCKVGRSAGVDRLLRNHKRNERSGEKMWEAFAIEPNGTTETMAVAACIIP